MNAGKGIKILGSGIYLPKAISSEEIKTKFNIPNGFAENFSGVKSRHHITFETNGYMGAKALENALIDAELDLKDIDIIISAGATFDYIIPNQSSVILSEMQGAKDYKKTTIDVNTTCLSFLSAFEVASKMLDGLQYKRIAIVSSEIASKGLNPNNPEMITLFGDGAAAFIIGYDEFENSIYYKGCFQTYTEGINDTIIKGGGNKYHFKDYSYDTKLHSFDMNGLKLLKLAKKILPGFINSFLNELQIELNDINAIIPHQASKAGLTILKNSFNLRKEQLMENIETHGNCIAASIPILLHESIKDGKIKRGDTCFLIGTSAGFSIGAILIKY
ncbi:MAG: beta-ketoacyl-ACP synthase III [Bacteroidia bacterium]|nr:beta-ketoacyl-ACP synthase III [Bacteroidia bacterium]